MLWLFFEANLEESRLDFWDLVNDISQIQKIAPSLSQHQSWIPKMQRAKKSVANMVWTSSLNPNRMAPPMESYLGVWSFVLLCFQSAVRYSKSGVAGLKFLPGLQWKKFRYSGKNKLKCVISIISSQVIHHCWKVISKWWIIAEKPISSVWRVTSICKEHMFFSFFKP